MKGGTWTGEGTRLDTAKREEDARDPDIENKLVECLEYKAHMARVAAEHKLLDGKGTRSAGLSSQEEALSRTIEVLKLIDSGSEIHTTASTEGCMPGSVRKVPEISLLTATGKTYRYKTIAKFELPKLRAQVWAYIVPGGLEILSTTGLFKEFGIRARVDPDDPHLLLKDGTKVPLEMVGDLPYLRTISGEFKRIATPEYYKTRKTPGTKLLAGIEIAAQHDIFVRKEHKEKACCSLNAHETLGAAAEEEEARIPAEHFRTHEPKRGDCPICRIAKVRRKPARRAGGRRTKEISPTARHRRRAARYGYRISMDNVLAKIQSGAGHQYATTVMDEFSEWVEAYPAKGSPNATWSMRCLNRFRAADDGASYHQVRTDNGAEFRGVFARMLEDERILHTRGIPHDPRTEARHESMHRAQNAGIRALLTQAWLPTTFWPDAAKAYHWLRNRHRIVRDTGQTAYELRVGRKYRGPYYVFGCEAIFMKEDPESKYEATGKRGMILGREQGGWLILDIEHLLKTRRRRTIISQNVSINNRKFPGRELNIKNRRGIGKPDEDTEFQETVCETCEKTITARKITCDACNNGLTTHGSNHTCQLYRCRCQDERDEHENVNSRTMVTQQPVEDNDDRYDASRLMGVEEEEESDEDALSADEDGRVTPQEDANAAIGVEAQGMETEQRTPKELQHYLAPGPKWNEGTRTGPRSTRKEINYRAMHEGDPDSNSEEEDDTDANRSTGVAEEEEIDENTLRADEDGRATLQEDADAVIGDPDFVSAVLREYEATKNRKGIGKKSKKTRRYLKMAAARKFALADALNSEAGIEAIVAELSKHAKNGTMDLHNIKERRNIKEVNARFVKSSMMMTIKNYEMDPEFHIVKARLVALGDRVLDAKGRQTSDEKDAWDKPIGLPGSRCIQARGIAEEDSTVIYADMDTAYLQADYTGRKPLYMEIDRRILGRPELRNVLGIPDDILQKFKEPVFRVIKSIYGTDRGAADLGIHIREKLEKLGWVEDKDVETNIFYQDIKYAGRTARVVMAMYVDDLSMSGPKSLVSKLFKEVSAVIEFKGSPEDHGKYLGATRHDVQSNNKHQKMSWLEMKDYTRLLINTYRRAANFDGEFKSRSTPMNAINVEDCSDEMFEPGSLQEAAPKLKGMALWLSRTTRPDISYATHVLTTFGKGTWTRLADKIMHELISYLNSTMDMGMLTIMDDRDIGNHKIQAYTDSDHGGCHITGRSTSGYVVSMVGEHGTKVIIDWGSKKQGLVAHSSAEAELVALMYATNMSIIPTAQMLKMIFRQPDMIVDTGIDNNAVREVAKVGYSIKLRYVSKTQRISLARVNEIYERTVGYSLSRVDTKDNTSDVFTKALDKELFEIHRSGLSVVAMDPSRLLN